MLGEILKSKRIECNYSAINLASLINVSESIYLKFESNKLFPSKEEIERLKSILSLDISDDDLHEYRQEYLKKRDKTKNKLIFIAKHLDIIVCLLSVIVILMVLSLSQVTYCVGLSLIDGVMVCSSFNSSSVLLYFLSDGRNWKSITAFVIYLLCLILSVLNLIFIKKDFTKVLRVISVLLCVIGIVICPISFTGVKTYLIPIPNM